MLKEAKKGALPHKKDILSSHERDLWTCGGDFVFSVT